MSKYSMKPEIFTISHNWFDDVTSLLLILDSYEDT